MTEIITLKCDVVGCTNKIRMKDESPENHAKMWHRVIYAEVGETVKKYSHFCPKHSNKRLPP